jgi:hypothetical protein
MACEELLVGYKVGALGDVGVIRLHERCPARRPRALVLYFSFCNISRASNGMLAA